MVQRSVHYHQEIVNVGDPATKIFLIKQGEVEISLRVDADGNPLNVSSVVRDQEEGNERRNRKGRSQAIALIGAGDAISDAVEVSPGVLVSSQDAMATSDDVVIYELPRTALDKLGSSKNGMVHS